jgi:hypothetical protein
MRALVLASVFAIGAIACTREGAGPSDPSQGASPAASTSDQVVQPATAGPPATEAQINWDAARADFSKRPAGMETFTPQAVGKEGPAPVPMLLPSGIVTTQSATDRPTPPVVTDDGYFATYHLPKYDAIVNGSMRAYAAGGQAAQGDREAMRFTQGDASAQLSFSRYGADYLIEFECREVDGDSCITEAEAKEFAESLFVAQTR